MTPLVANGAQLGWTFDPDRPVYQVRQPAPKEPPQAGRKVQAYLWARTILCWHCTALIPLSPDWRLDAKAKLAIAVDPLPDGTPHFRVVPRSEMSPPTVIKGVAICPHCDSTSPKGYPSKEAQAGRLLMLMYCNIIRNRTVRHRAGKPPVKGKTWLDFEVPANLHYEALKVRYNHFYRLGAPDIDLTEDPYMWRHYPPVRGRSGAPDRYAETDPSILELGLLGGEPSDLMPAVAKLYLSWGWTAAGECPTCGQPAASELVVGERGNEVRMGLDCDCPEPTP